MKNILTKIRRNSIPNSRISEVLGFSKELLDTYMSGKLNPIIQQYVETQLTKQFFLYNLQRRAGRRKDANYGITLKKGLEMELFPKE